MNSAEIGIVVADTSEATTIAETRQILDQMGITYTERVIGTPFNLNRISGLGDCKIWICTSGKVPYLPLVVAGTLDQPVIAIPLPSNSLTPEVIYALLQSENGLPLAVVAPYNARGAALLAVHWLAMTHSSYRDLLMAYRKRFLLGT